MSASQCNIHTFFWLASVAVFAYSKLPVLILTCESSASTFALQPNATLQSTETIFHIININEYSCSSFVHLYVYWSESNPSQVPITPISVCL